jgi:hypothetical protein
MSDASREEPASAISSEDGLGLVVERPDDWRVFSERKSKQSSIRCFDVNNDKKYSAMRPCFLCGEGRASAA